MKTQSAIPIEDRPKLERFLSDIAKWCQVDIERCVNENYPSCSAADVWDDKQYMSGVAGAPCTLELKREARRQWESRNKCDWHVLGFTCDEIDRYTKFASRERGNVIPVLIDDGITKEDCFEIIAAAGIQPPRIYSMGYPNANCIGCVKATSATYWNHVRKMHPLAFKARAEQSRRIGCRLVRHNGKRIFLDELPVDAVGAPMQNWNVECGIFCSEDDK